ncbi:MAG: hypothetical protein IPK50_04985 [Fibrobacterota bacterium]|nr:hypothetical protein [Fibrobacterota bacterium]QQS06249.1 MAG: hypothetical protein IPK50_04985 [Fibrobacterota bacterium]
MSTSTDSRIRGLLGLALVSILLVLPGNAFGLTRKNFDFVIGGDGDFKAAKDAAAKKASSSYRYHIFFPDGQYDIGSLTGDTNQMTTFSVANVSMIGQSSEKTVIYNKSKTEGLSITATFNFNKADNLYLQDLSVQNKADYTSTSSFTETGRHAAVKDGGNRVIYKNVKLLSTQDTYVTGGARTYWEGGEIHGTTDFICGGGDVFFEGVRLYSLKKSAITASAPSGATWGYVFNNCTIDANAEGYTLGRSWRDASVVYLNTKMNKLPVSTGWGDPMNSVPKVFAEYKSKNGSGALVDLSKRRTSYTKDANTVTLNPVLTDAQAAKYTLAAVLGGSDNWQPQSSTKQVEAPIVRQEGGKLLWNDDANALCWAVFRDGKYVANVTTNSYDVSKLATGSVMTVRAANAMGGLGASSVGVKLGAVSEVSSGSRSNVRPTLAIRGRTIAAEGFEGPKVELQIVDLAGRVVFASLLETSSASSSVTVAPGAVPRGVYVVRAMGGDGGFTIGRMQWMD